MNIKIGVDVNSSILLFFFFFQAEDGIRDLYVTGVQTCALPICGKRDWRAGSLLCRGARMQGDWSRLNPRICVGIQESDAPNQARPCRGIPRSEERRVGKECRSRVVADP